MKRHGNEEPNHFDHSFKEHPIFSFICTFIVGVLVFILIYIIVCETLRFQQVAERVNSEPLSTFVGALLTTVVALAGAVVTVVLARLGLKLGENAQESSESLHSFEYRGSIRQELIPAINAIHALGDAAASFIASGRPLRLAMKRHMQIRALSEGIQAGPPHPVDFMAYRFDRRSHVEEMNYFIEKANFLKMALDDVMRHQIAIAAIDKCKCIGDNLMAHKLMAIANEKIISGGDSPLNKIHFMIFQIMRIQS